MSVSVKYLVMYWHTVMASPKQDPVAHTPGPRAPNAKGVRVVGDFNGWNGTAHPMRTLGGSGVWELFVPDVGQGRELVSDGLGELLVVRLDE